jgi:hypothetical protein
MSKEHVAGYLDRAIALGFEEAAEEAVRAAATRLPDAGSEIIVSLVVSDDLKGGWTNRFASEASICFEQAPLLKRGMIAAPLWTSEEPSKQDAHAEVLATCYRSASHRLVGAARTLGEQIIQEGLAARFGGTKTTLDEAQVLRARDVLRTHMSSADPAVCLPALFGDEAAQALGYTPLGLPPRAGFAVGLVATEGADPVALLDPGARRGFMASMST